MPKIDWRDDDQPRGERFGRPQRRRLPAPGRPTIPLRRWDVDLGPPPRTELPTPARRPLHLIWGPPQPRTP